MPENEEDGKQGSGTALEESSAPKEAEAESKPSEEGNQEVPKEAEEASSAGTETGEGQGKEEDSKIPKSRLDEVIAQREEERRRVERLEDELREVRSRQDQSGKPKTWDDLSLEELERARNYYEEQGDDKQVRFVDRQIVRRETREEINREREAMQKDQTKAMAWQGSLSHSKEVVGKLNDKAFDLGDPKSRIRQLTVEILNAESDLQNHPKGPSAAYEVALGRMLLERQLAGGSVKKALKTPPAKPSGDLDSGGRSQPTGSSLERQESEAFNEPDPRIRERKISKYLGQLEKSRKSQTET